MIAYLSGVHAGKKEAKAKHVKPWVGLTHAERIEVYSQKDWDSLVTWDYEQAIEDKLKEKNT